jgi:hypothetical protein
MKHATLLLIFFFDNIIIFKVWGNDGPRRTEVPKPGTAGYARITGEKNA